MMMEKSKTGISPEQKDELESTMERYRQHGLSLSDDLDRWAEVHVVQLKKRGIIYPKEASVEERWLSLRAAFEKTKDQQKLETLLTRVKTYAQRIEDAMKQGSDAYMQALRSEPRLNPDELEESLSDALDQNPELESLVKEVRINLKKLRQLTC